MIQNEKIRYVPSNLSAISVRLNRFRFFLITRCEIFFHDRFCFGLHLLRTGEHTYDRYKVKLSNGTKKKKKNAITSLIFSSVKRENADYVRTISTSSFRLFLVNGIFYTSVSSVRNSCNTFSLV